MPPTVLNVTSLNKLLVSCYKAMGFVALTVILMGLVGYIGLNMFFLVSRSWIAPTILSRADERVLTLSAQAAHQATLRDELRAERLDLVGQVEEADRLIASQSAFQEGFRHALQADLAARRAELDKLWGLSVKYRQSKSEIERGNQEYVSDSREQTRELYAMHVVDGENYAATNYHLSQIAHSNLSLEENQVSLENHVAEVSRDIGSLQSIKRALASGDKLPRDGEISYQVLRIKQDYSNSVRELAKARSSRTALEQKLAILDGSIQRYDRVLKGIRESAYLQAVERNLNVAFVPYENVGKVRDRSPVYGCRLGLFICRRVGTAVETLEGEVQGRHPLHASTERGMMVRLELEEPQAAKERVLFLNGPPLVF
jgi:hypothetical protein